MSVTYEWIAIGIMTKIQTSIRVVGAGLQRNGTKSLTNAFEMLCTQPCHPMTWVALNKRCDGGLRAHEKLIW